MKKLVFLIFLLFLPVSSLHAETKDKYFWSDWRIFSYFQSDNKSVKYHKKDQEYYNQLKGFQPYLENSREVQIPQWEHKDWVLEDWFTQQKGIDMVKGFYDADIFRDQYQNKDREGHPHSLKKLVVGPNFYRLSGFDKRRVVAILDATYGVTDQNQNDVVILEDWHSKRPIGTYDQNGLRLH